MGVLRKLCLTITLMLAAAPTLAHDDAAEMGHQWLQPAYYAEMRLQFVVIGAVMCVTVVWWASHRTRKKWSKQR